MPVLRAHMSKPPACSPGPRLVPRGLCSTSASLLLGHAPLGHEVVLVVVLHAAPDAEAEVGQSRVHANVPVEVLVRLVEHATVVAGVDIVPPAVLRRIDMHLGHTL